MRPTSLAMALEQLEGFDDPSADLEQYATPADVASRVLILADDHGDLDGTVVDLGCGTGVLGIGAAILGARPVAGVDVDAAALGAARRNASRAGVAEATSWIRGAVDVLPLAVSGATVVMNPPFGAQRHGADRPFLDAAAAIADVAYTVHNEGSRDFVEAYCDGEITAAYRATLTLPHSFPFHEERRRDVTAEVYRIAF